MEHRDQTFRKQVINLDGNTYTGCSFHDCHIVFHGTAGGILSACNFYDVKWVLDGSAKLTIDFLMGLYHEGGDVGRRLVEGTFANIRRGKMPDVNPPTGG